MLVYGRVLLKNNTCKEVEARSENPQCGCNWGLRSSNREVRMALHGCLRQAREPGLCTPTSDIPSPGCSQAMGEAVSWSWEQCPVREAGVSQLPWPKKRVCVENTSHPSNVLPGFPVPLLRWENRQLTEGRCSVRPVNSVMLHITTIFVTTAIGGSGYILAFADCQLAACPLT